MLFALIWIVGLTCGQIRLTFGTNWKKHLVKVRGDEILNARSSAVEDYHSEMLLFRPDLSTPVAN
jgi:hypothetical protein